MDLHKLVSTKDMEHSTWLSCRKKELPGSENCIREDEETRNAEHRVSKIIRNYYKRKTA